MSCRIYTTDAVILKRRNAGEADCLFSFYTKEFGRLEVKARGVRNLKSKLRYSLSPLSLLRISFVTGSSGFWHLVDAAELESWSAVRKNYAKTQMLLRVFSLMERLLQGQEADFLFWDFIMKTARSIGERDLSQEDLENFRLLTAFRIVCHLGYAEKVKNGVGLSLRDVSRRRGFFVSAIEKALESSHL